MPDGETVNEFVVIEDPIEHANRHSKLKFLIFGIGFGCGLPAGYFGSELLAKGLESKGLSEYMLFLGCASMLLVQIGLRKLVKHMEEDFLDRWDSDGDRDVKEELKIHLFQVLEAVLVGCHGAFDLNVGTHIIK